MSKKDSSRERLLAALAEQHMVRVERTPKFADRLDGFIVQVGEKWALMAQISDGGFFNGHIAFRLRDVGRIKRDKSFAPVHARTQPEWPPAAPPNIGLDSVGDVLRGLGSDETLMGIQKENERHAMWIGVSDEILGKYFYLHEVRPDATWHKKPLDYKLKAITAVEIGTRYMVGLSAVAGRGPHVAADAEERRLA
jgi:hypothetical protein